MQFLNTADENKCLDFTTLIMLHLDIIGHTDLTIVFLGKDIPCPGPAGVYVLTLDSFSLLV